MKHFHQSHSCSALFLRTIFRKKRGYATIAILEPVEQLKMPLAFFRHVGASVENVEKYTCACLAFTALATTHNALYTPYGFIDTELIGGTIRPGEWRAEVPSGSFEPFRSWIGIKRG